MGAPFILDSVTHLHADHRGRVGYCASHGGLYAAYLAARAGVAAVILNDAGIGREQAGVAGLRLLDGLSVPAAAVSHATARIGDGLDGAARGRLTFVNEAARAIGLVEGMPCQDALQCLTTPPLQPSPAPPGMAEVRFDIPTAGRNRARVVGMDSISLATEADIGQIVVAASHGGLLGHRPKSAIKVAAFAAVYNDAGFGIDQAGISRLPALDARGIAGACVSCFSARIGDARSTYEDGFVSAVNGTARRYGGGVGQSCREFVAAMLAATG